MYEQLVLSMANKLLVLGLVGWHAHWLLQMVTWGACPQVIVLSLGKDVPPVQTQRSRAG